MHINVIKLGGKVSIENLIDDIKRMRKSNHRIVIVHGGGQELTDMLNRLNVSTRFINGLRYTDEITLEVAKMVFSKIREEIVSKLNINNINAIGLSGSNRIFNVKPLNIKKYGYVAIVDKVNTEKLLSFLEKNVIVISPIGVDQNGTFYNINADEVANKVASALKADRLIYLTDKPGILRDVNDMNSTIEEINISDINIFINRKIVSKGMIPKLLSSANAIRNGVKEVFIIFGCCKDPIHLYFSGKIKGTRIVSK